MSDEQENFIDKDELIKSFEVILNELNSLGDWNFSNATKLNRLNSKRHSFAGDMIELGLETGTSWAYSTDETDREIYIAQETRPKKKKDLIFHESNYHKGIRHLRDEIQQYIDKLKE